MYNPYQQNPYNPYFGQMNPYAQPMQPSVTPPPQYQPIQNQRPQMPQTELSPQRNSNTLPLPGLQQDLRQGVERRRYD